MKEMTGKAVPSQSLDMQLAKRKASNDDSRFRGNNRYQNLNSKNNNMARYLDESLEFTTQGTNGKSK